MPYFSELSRLSVLFFTHYYIFFIALFNWPKSIFNMYNSMTLKWPCYSEIKIIRKTNVYRDHRLWTRLVTMSVKNWKKPRIGQNSRFFCKICWWLINEMIIWTRVLLSTNKSHRLCLFLSDWSGSIRTSHMWINYLIHKIGNTTNI